MWCIVGLGNPGRKYAGTRHNVGFVLLERLAGEFGIRLKEGPAHKEGRGSIRGAEVVLVEPLTFMNLSGTAVREVMDRDGLSPDNTIILHDDIDMPPGRVKIKRGGSSGGHKGVGSIILETGETDFIRVKMGVGKAEGVPVEEHVLSPFGEQEMPAVTEALQRAFEAVLAIIADGVEAAMNRFNTRPSAAGEEGAEDGLETG